MKRKLLILILALLLTLALSISASAAEYGVIYTETDLLQSDEISELGQYELPLFTDTYGIDLRVDVLTTLGDFSSAEEAAVWIYENYGYGYGDGRNGISLTLLVHEDADGVALDEWYVYAGGTSHELTTNGPWNVYPNLNEIMTEENWDGDAGQDSGALAAAIRGMRDGMEHFVLAGGVHSTIWHPEMGFVDGYGEVGTGDDPVDDPVPDIPTASTPDSFPTAGETIGYVTDTAGIMSEDERDTLEEAARDISEKYGFGVYIITVDSFRDHTDSYDVFDGATTLYRKYKLGIGEESKGVLLLLSLEDRDFSLITYSDYGNFIFDTETRESMTSWFLDNFAMDDWYGGFADYLMLCQEVLADGPDKVQGEVHGMVAIIFILPLIVAFIVIFVLGAKMKSVFKATRAEIYAEGGLHITDSYDRFTHTTETRRKRSTSSSGGGRSGGVSSRSSGGFGGTSGKF